uniref:REKLES domain-containing protein n=1 Tax=Panagrolaimus sp. ES5 TaxID=591445 RepID=A0AC34FCB3_9BILA
MYVSMEVNGTMYQGILFAMPNVNSNNGKINNHNVNNGRSTSNSPSPQNFNSSMSEGIDMEALSALFGADMSKFNPTSTAASE